MSPREVMRPPVAGVSLALLIGILGGAAAQEEPGQSDFVIAGAEGPECPLIEGTTLRLVCWMIEEGDINQDFVAGANVTITVRAVGDAPHVLAIAYPEDRDPLGVDTKLEDAIAASETVEGGEETTFTFQVPTDTDELYVWCDVLEHEAAGMWFVASVTDPNGSDPGPEPGPTLTPPTPTNSTAPMTSNTTQTGDGNGTGQPKGTEGGQSPGVAFFVVAAAVAGVVLAARSRRR